MSTVSGSKRLEATFSTHNNDEYAESVTADDATVTRHISTNPIGVEGDSVSTKQLNNVQVREFLSLSSKLEMVSNTPQTYH